MKESTTEKRAIIVPASAGSGKTYRIAHEYIYDVLRNRYDEEGNPYFDRTFYKRILAVTFTNKATEEMKSRILKEINLLASGAKSDHLKELMSETQLDERTLRKRAKIVRSLILHDYSHFTVLTNDTFFQRILRAFVRELGIDINFSIELDTAPIVSRSVESLIEDITTNKELRQWLEDLTAERISDGERWDIRGAITALNSELFKESTHETITKAKDKESLKRAIKNFERNVKEKQEVFKKLGERALQMIAERGYSHDDFKGKFTKIFEKVVSCTLDKISDTNLSHLTDSTVEWFCKGKATPDLLALANELQDIYNDIYNVHLELNTLENTLHILSSNFRGFALLRDLQEKAADICREDNSMLLSESKHAISGFISEADAPFIYEKAGNYFDKFMIDEFQDTSVKEWHNFLPLLRNAMAQSTDTSVLIVGDVKQSIYRWRGGDWRILGKEVKSDLKECHSEPLKNNWRSLPNIVEFNNSLYNDFAESENKRLNTLLEEGYRAERISTECRAELYDTLKDAYAELEQTPRRKHTNGGYISITAAAEGDFKNESLIGKSGMPLYIERIQEVLERGFLPRDITILVRKNSEGMDIAEELLHYRDRFPKELWFEITTEEALNLASSPAVKLVIAIMRLAINRNDATSLMMYNHLHNNDLFNAKLNDEEVAFLDLIRMMSPEEAFEHITIRYADDLKGQTAHILALHEYILRFSSGKVADIALFDKWWREKGDSLSIRVERSDRAIEILTIHKAKGLENKVVIIPNCSWSLEPLISTGYQSNIIWSQPSSDHELSTIGQFPILFNNAVRESLFADGYFREMVYTCVDAINTMYVATTRAKEQLYIFIPNKQRVRNPIGALLCTIYADKMQRVGESGLRYYEIGTFDAPEPEEGAKESACTTTIKEYLASPVSLKFRTSVSRYFADEEGKNSPRSMGIRLHQVFEGATSREDIFDKLEEMSLNGVLHHNEAADLKNTISQTLDTTIAGSWFDGSWEEHHNERNIIRPNNTLKRPDRVMTRGNEATVVDYKFGDEFSAYNRQIKEYISELHEMGYTSVKGYIWYVTAGKIVQIEE